MNKKIKIIVLAFILSIALFSCTKKPVTLDKETPMKTLIKASDEEITELIMNEVKEMGNIYDKNISEENVDIEYILRDEKSQAIAVKLKINEQ